MGTARRWATSSRAQAVVASALILVMVVTGAGLALHLLDVLTGAEGRVQSQVAYLSALADADVSARRIAELERTYLLTRDRDLLPRVGRAADAAHAHLMRAQAAAPEGSRQQQDAFAIDSEVRYWRLAVDGDLELAARDPGAALRMTLGPNELRRRHLEALFAGARAHAAREMAAADAAFLSARTTSGRIVAVTAFVGAIAVIVLIGFIFRLRERRERELMGLASTDPLTGLANHRAFQERLQAEAGRADRYGRSLALATFDLDHFKTVNDTFGHQAGDRVLAAVGEVLGAEARQGDLAARVGGEEFALILPETEGLSAWQAAERVRETVARMRLPGLGPVTVSAGVCDLEQADTAGEMVRLADIALYWAKAHGRDCSFRFTPEAAAALAGEEDGARLARLQALTAIRALARAVDAKDPSTQRHSERVSALAGRLAGELGWPADRRAMLEEAALVHDVGKIGVPDAILGCPGPLGPAEMAVVRQHPVLGARIVADALSEEQTSWVRHHHERYDGLGYPDGLSGDDIPEGARILAAADAWDAMTAARPYREALPVDRALWEVALGAGTQFCPRTAEVLPHVLEGAAGRSERPAAP